MNGLLEQLAQEFSDKEYAHAYMQSHAVTRIAAQIHALRKQRGWTQQELARKTGIAQERISKIESGDFDSLTMRTLQRFAEGFDVDLRIAFTSFSDGLLDIANLNAESLKVESRETDLARAASRKFISHGGAWQSLDAPVQLRVVAIRPSVTSSDHEWQPVSELRAFG